MRRARRGACHPLTGPGHHVNAEGHRTMQAPFPAAGPFVNPDAMIAAASLVEREWGSYGYSLAVARTSGRVTIFEVTHFDGSCFNVAADKWGNARGLSDDLDTATAEVVAMSDAASVA